MNILLQVKQSFDVFWIFRFKGIKNAFVITLGIEASFNTDFVNQL